MPVPVFNKSIQRRLFITNIQHEPIVITFRGKSPPARKNELSYERKITNSAYDSKTVCELMIALDAGDSVPTIDKPADNIQMEGRTWKIMNVNPDPGQDCYTLELILK
jgi:hypothetical protein